MYNTYNIYKIKHEKIDQLKEKLNAVGLEEQKTLLSKKYSMTFYFSNNLIGNEIWWWQTYRDFFKEDIPEPKNIFHFGMLLCHNNDNPEIIYAVSLGKSHFYLSKFIHPDFGIDLAVRMADENTILLKKSRYFAGTKRQDVSSYQSFQLDSYEPGESVDHLKLKASNKEIWGDRNIIFADSIQMDMDKNPFDLSDIYDQIDSNIMEKEVIHLPKLESVPDELTEELDSLLFTAIKNMEGNVKVEEFYVYGVTICFSFHDYGYRLSTKKPGQDGYYRKDIGNTLEISNIADFLNEHPDIDKINSIRIQFKNDESGLFTKDLKEVLDLPIEHEGYHYFLRNGDWHKFNQTFMEYLKRSLNSIETLQGEDLNEADYDLWKIEKERKIAIGEPVEDKLLYRETYFNKKQCIDHGFTLMDRQLTLIQALEKGKAKYRVEVADLFRDGEIISVKISETNHQLIYNIEQSKDAIELITRGTIPFEETLTTAALWFVFEGDVKKITDFNSIQFLLAIESWQKLVKNLGLKPRLYISKHII
ncbi:hypothetical protein C4K05_2769 [Pseudomonas chlororaphis subsp. aureofaciens]|uniref:DUF6119 family protein n=1 Tax=Pseudomonas chlororaphis TaxID=587753 RepID=UPI000F573CA0|nr:DUF6119 family protein [Pseudomonas chlororaphis]AZE10990.1 hypothetical protein C4K10_2710 [Pseudomonas chlororaphis subsp. aureofaciens]AZE35759.1 hypothetical protein C4K06_2726 [Pseudomonas chlororaphis subsp. aureofaciens]AZE42109.1 hypothetical protein C4K05_2769 [Pseudomonas chlororaphis subsp. aureofaciens]